MIKPQNSITPINALPSLPLYYQPHILMQDQLPVLVLRPVLAQNSSSSPQVSSIESDFKGLNLEGMPLVFPLGSRNGEMGESVGPQVHLKDVSSASDAESTDPRRKNDKIGSQSIGAELISGYASSVTESEMDEAPMSKPSRAGRKQNDFTRSPPSHRMPTGSAKENSVGRSLTKPYDWEFPPTNPFDDDYDNDLSTSLSDSKGSNSTVPTTTSLYNKQGARSKTTNKTNPFAPEIPPRSDIDLSRNDFSSIPKSMLAGKEPPYQYSANQLDQEGVITRTHRRRLSSESMITLIESECEEGSPMDITSAVASQGSLGDNPYPSPFFEPSSTPFFEQRTPTVSPSNSSVAAMPRSQSDSITTMPSSQSQSIATREQPKKPKPKLVS
jgi:hypothetical protein